MCKLVKTRETFVIGEKVLKILEGLVLGFWKKNVQCTTNNKLKELLKMSIEECLQTLFGAVAQKRRNNRNISEKHYTLNIDLRLSQPFEPQNFWNFVNLFLSRILNFVRACLAGSI